MSRRVFVGIFETEEDILDTVRIRLVQRLLAQFMGAGELVRSVAEGEPVVVGLINKNPDAPTGELSDSAHAWVLYKVDFSFLAPMESKDVHLEVMRAMTDLIVAYNSRSRAGDDNIEALREELRRFTQRAVEINKNIRYGISIEKVYLMNPYDYEEHPDLVPLRKELSGDEFGERLIYALNRERAEQIVPRFRETTGD